MIESRSQDLLENINFSKDSSLHIAKDLCASFSNEIPKEFQEDLFARIELAHETYIHGLPNRAQRDSAFLVHPRDSAASIDQGIYYADADGAFPALQYIKSTDIQHNKALQKKKLELLNSLPPFEAATTTAQSFDGSPLVGSIVCIPLDIDRMLSVPSQSARLNGYARPLIYSATDFVGNKLGTVNIGLGEQIAAITQFGQWLEKKFNGTIYTTTGHAGTIFAMAETLKLGSENLELDLSSETVGVIGCGRIGSAFVEYIDSQHMVRNLIMYDRAPGVAEKLAENILKSRVQNNGHKVEVAQCYEEILNRTSLIVSAVSDPLLGELPLDNHFVVDDSQPPWVPPQDSSGIIAWPSYTMPSVVQRNGVRMYNGEISTAFDEFNYGPVGLIPRTDWGCNVELTTLLMHGLMSEKHVSRPTSRQDVSEIGMLIQQAGFSVQTLQSWGKIISEESFAQLRSNI